MRNTPDPAGVQTAFRGAADALSKTHNC
ncbi:hypothetical protein [Caulobacter sp. B11]